MKPTYILAIESSCDDTGAAVIKNGKILSNIVANQAVHQQYGGVVPELASRAHQQNIVPVVSQAINQANIHKNELSAIAYTKGPGLMGSLLVGMSFAKSLAQALQLPLIEVNHMQAHVLAHFIKEDNYTPPTFPFLCLTISGGHTQLINVKGYFDFELLGETLDDAVGEAYDKVAKIIGLPYPGGPLVDQLAQKGNPEAYTFSQPKIEGYNFSFSGVKTSILYFLQKEMKKNPSFIEENKEDICASVQKTLIDILLKKLLKASKDLGISQLAIAGGVSANSEIRKRLLALPEERYTVYIPKFEYTTDNAAMIAMVGELKYHTRQFAQENSKAQARYALTDNL